MTNSAPRWQTGFAHLASDFGVVAVFLVLGVSSVKGNCSLRLVVSQHAVCAQLEVASAAGKGTVTLHEGSVLVALPSCLPRSAITTRREIRARRRRGACAAQQPRAAIPALHRGDAEKERQSSHSEFESG